MRCIFCKNDSGGSSSVEHILPESLGNSSLVLPPGVVCDKCNNYFAIKVEKPFLETDAVKHLRFHQVIPNKRGRVPAVDGLLMPGYPAVLRKDPTSGLAGFVEVDDRGLSHVISNDGGRIIFPVACDPPQRVVSRFLAKTAVESMAVRLIDHPEWLESFTSEIQLDEIRNHARWGTTLDWPFHTRRIYEMDAEWADETGKSIQILHESDILKTDWDEWFFVLALFGLELVINYGGPEIDGYKRWLAENQHRSPLYTGKHSDDRAQGRLARDL